MAKFTGKEAYNLPEYENCDIDGSDPLGEVLRKFLQSRSSKRKRADCGASVHSKPRALRPPLPPKKKSVLQEQVGGSNSVSSQEAKQSQTMTSIMREVVRPDGSRSFFIPTWSSTKVCLNISPRSDVARLGLWCIDKPVLIPSISIILEKHKMELVSIRSTPPKDGNWKTFILAIRSEGPRPDQMLDGVTVEQMYKEAAQEIAFSI